MDKKIDIKKISFGSTISKDDSHKREEYYSVKDVISASTLILNNGLKVHLLGIKEKEDIKEQAVEFIRKKVKGRKVFMKYDTTKFDDNDCLLCYLYLDNKTFINAHILKAGLANVDESINFKYKNKFLDIIYGKSLD